MDEHNGRIFRELSERLLASGQVEEAITAAQSGVYAAMEDPTVHVAYALALARAGRHAQARTEFDSALLCPVDASDLAAAHLAYSRYLEGQGELDAAGEHQRRAHQLDPQLSPARPR